MSPSANGRGPGGLKLFDQVSCTETLCINRPIGTATEAPVVINYWTFKLWPQQHPSILPGLTLKEKKKRVHVYFFLQC